MEDGWEMDGVAVVARGPEAVFQFQVQLQTNKEQYACKTQIFIENSKEMFL